VYFCGLYFGTWQGNIPGNGFKCSSFGSEVYDVLQMAGAPSFTADLTSISLINIMP
jgi:hypothetical protein